jgi:hypothetical protein
VLPGGPHCTDAKAFLQTLKQEQPALNIRVRDVMLEPAALVRLQLFARDQASRQQECPLFHGGMAHNMGQTNEQQIINSLLGTF